MRFATAILAAALVAHGGAAAVPPQGTELFRCQVHRADKFLEDALDRMAAAEWKGVSQVQIHIRTDLSLPDPFCPSSACIRRAIARLHANGATAQAFAWTEGGNKDVLRKIWNLGFDNFATDDPLVLFELLPELGARDVSD